jgi:hypothetical protein
MAIQQNDVSRSIQNDSLKSQFDQGLSSLSDIDLKKPGSEVTALLNLELSN